MTTATVVFILLTITCYAKGEYVSAKDEEGNDLVCTVICEPKHYLNCLDAKNNGELESGVYLLKAYCDMESDGGGWTVFQRRKDGSVDFYLGWNDYVNGFGDASEEHWLGLSKIHRLANGNVSTELRVDMKDLDGVDGYAKYSSFYIGGSSTDYTLHVSGYSGPSNVGDSLAYHDGHKFSTKNDDNDARAGNCAVRFSGAWWYKSCHESNLNGLYGDDAHGKGINWKTWKGHKYSLPFTELKVRAVNSNTK